MLPVSVIMYILESPSFCTCFPMSNPCLRIRYPYLMFLTPEECDYGRRLLFSVVLGSVVGYERRHSERSAGIRTMALVSLGSCLFTLTSMFAFRSGPMSWDASRVSAAIPSGVGFLGAGLICKFSAGRVAQRP